MSYIFSSNGNNYTFKKLDNMLINMPEKDGHHVLIRETVDGVPQYSWGSAACIVKANEAFVFEYTPETTESFNTRTYLYPRFLWNPVDFCLPNTS